MIEDIKEIVCCWDLLFISGYENSQHRFGWCTSVDILFK